MFVWVLWHISLCGLFNAKSIFIEINCSISNNSVEHKYAVSWSKKFLFQAIQFRQTVQFQPFQFSISIIFVYSQVNIKTVLSQAIQFSITTQFSFIWLVDRTLSGATTPGQSRPGSNGNEGVLCIPQSSSITGTSPSDCVVPYPGHSLRGCFTSLQRCNRCILQTQPTGQNSVNLMIT